MIFNLNVEWNHHGMAHRGEKCRILT